jgi:hypothetical protein
MMMGYAEQWRNQEKKGRGEIDQTQSVKRRMREDERINRGLKVGWERRRGRS